MNFKEKLYKPHWIKIKLPNNNNHIQKITVLLRKTKLHTVCEEASCPNLVECFNKGTATFLILGVICTRRCPFCDISHGRPMIPDHSEPERLAQTILDMKLRHVVITSVDRDDLRDGGAQHFVDCFNKIRIKNPTIRIEMLAPDFRGCMKYALKIINTAPPNIFNHNIESVPRLYQLVKPGAKYNGSLKLLELFKKTNPNISTKSGLVLGFGETFNEVIAVMRDLYSCGVTILTIGQYLRPSINHLPVQRYLTPQEFNTFKIEALNIGFQYVSSGPFIRSSYHAELQADNVKLDNTVVID